MEHFSNNVEKLCKAEQVCSRSPTAVLTTRHTTEQEGPHLLHSCAELEVWCWCLASPHVKERVLQVHMQKLTSMPAFKCISGVFHASQGWKWSVWVLSCRIWLWDQTRMVWRWRTPCGPCCPCCSTRTAPTTRSELCCSTSSASEVQRTSARLLATSCPLAVWEFV